MADIRVNELPTLGEVAAEDILHILDASTTDDVDSQTTVDAVADWIIANKSVRITGIDDVPGLRAALDGKADIVHTHTIAQVIGLQADLDAKTDVTQAQIIGRNIVLNGKSINVPSTIGGLQDDRIPDTVIEGEYLQFGTTGGGINNISGDDLKGNIGLNLVNNTADISKPVSVPQQSALDLKVDTTTYTTGQSLQDINILSNGLQINTNTAAIALNTDKISFDTESSNKLATIETGADITDTTNVWSSLGISNTGSTNQFLTQRGVFVESQATSINKTQIDNAIGSGTLSTDYYASDKTWKPIPSGGGGNVEVTKQAVDTAIGVFSSGDSAQFYNEQGNFVDAVYDSIENAPIIRNRTIESIVLSGTRSNVQARLTGVSELSTITMQNTFDSSPTQYTTTLASPNTTLSPVISLPAGSQGRQLSLTETDGTVHRFCYLVNGNYRLLAGGLTGTVRLGPIAVATTATVTAAVTVPDQTAGQTITLAGDETGTFSVGDFISPQANNFGAYRGIFIDSITFNGTNTVIVGPSNGATTFNTTSVLRNAGLATEIQGTIPTFSGDPDIANTVYSSSIPATEFTVLGVNTSAHLIQVANAFAALETAITTDGIVTDNGDGTSSITVNYNTETNIDSSFTITGGLNNMESIVNVDGMIGDLSPATTVTVTDPEATEVVSFTSSAATTATNNVDDIAAQIVTAVNNNEETPINFDAQYDSATKTIILTAEEAGNTNPWTITFNNNGVTNENAGNLGYTSSQSGEVINQTDVLTVHGLSTFSNNNDTLSGTAMYVNGYIRNLNNPNSFIDLAPNFVQWYVDGSIFVSMVNFQGQLSSIELNSSHDDVDFRVGKNVSGNVIDYNAGTDTLTFDATTINGLPGGADGLSITDTVNLNLLDGTTVLSTVVLPSSGGTTIIAGTANEIVNTVSGDTNTLSLAPAITDAITANTAKTGITTEQAAAITSNTGKTGITVAQSNAIIANTAKVGITTTQSDAITANTSKVGITTAQASAITANTAKTSNVDILPLDNVFTGVNVFNNTSSAGAIQVGRISGVGDTSSYINFSSNTLALSIGTEEKIRVSDSALTINPFAFDYDFIVNKQTTGQALNYDSVADTFTIGSDVLTINSTTINGLPSKADALSISGQVLSLLDGTTVLDSVTLPSGGTSTTVQGTSGQIGVNTVGNTATVSLDTAITSAITANTAKQSVAGLNQVGAAIVASDSVIYYAGTALAPRRKVFSSVPLSIMNNDSGFTTNTGTVTSVTGTANEVDVATGTTAPVVSLNNMVTSAITANTNKTGITTAQSSAITANTAKVGITTAQTTAITNNTAKVGITTAQAGEITANTAKIGVTKATVDTAIGDGANTTDYYASDKTWKTIPSGGGSADAVEFMVTSYGFESDLSGVGGVNNFDVYAGNHSGTLNGFMRFYTNGALTGNSFYVGGATLRATTVAGTITLPTIDSNGNAIPAYTAGQSLVITNPAGDVFTANLASEVTGGDLPTGFPSDLRGWRTSTTEVSAGFPADVVGDIFSTPAVAVANQVFNQGALIYYLTEGYQKTSTGTLTTVGTTAEIPTVDTANDWTTTTSAGGGTSTTVLGTAGEIDITTVGNTATASLDTAITGAITANTAKNSYPTADANKLAGIAAGATANVGDAVLANTQTFTGLNTFSNAGGIQSNRVTGIVDTDTYIDISEAFDDSMLFYTGGAATLGMATNTMIVNPLQGDVDFQINKQTAFEAIIYNGGTDTFTVNADNIVGIASAETGTWTPTIQNAGTTSNVVARYTKSGSNVIAHVQADTTGGNAFIGLSIVLSSLPFALDSTLRVALGTYFTAATSSSLATSSSGVLAIDSVNINFLDNANNTYLRGNDTRGFIGLTITYETTD